LQAKYHKADVSERSSQSENGDIKPSASLPHKQHSRRVSAQHSGSHDGSNSSTKDQDNDSAGDHRPTNQDCKRRKSNHGSNRDLSHGSESDGKLTVSKSRGRHKSCDVPRSKIMSGQSSTQAEEDQSHDAAGAPASENSGLLTVSANNSGVMMSRSHQDLSGNYPRFSPRPSSSRVSSRADVRGYEPVYRRTASGVSASNSVGSGLDDDDYIDPHRDVGVAVCIRDGYFSWLPRATSDALISDINFVADAGWFSFYFCDIYATF